MNGKVNHFLKLNRFAHSFMKSCKRFSSEETLKEIAEHKKSIDIFGDINIWKNYKFSNL